MTDLDHFATAALPLCFHPNLTPDQIAADCYQMALAMVRARDQLVPEEEGPAGILGGVLVRQVPGKFCEGCEFQHGRVAAVSCMGLEQRAAGFHPCNLTDTIFIKVAK